jgi:hypothetical protein
MHQIFLHLGFKCDLCRPCGICGLGQKCELLQPAFGIAVDAAQDILIEQIDAENHA